MSDQIEREEGCHGARWDSMHGGYFSDPDVAGPLVRTVEKLAAEPKPDVIVDLGGGTGFLLSQLSATNTGQNTTLVNLDDSAAQLDAAQDTGISCVRGSVNAFRRNVLAPADSRFLFMMRSVLHYFGQDGLRPALRHLRSQARPGEMFIHQTASFGRQQDADCLNELYAMMRTQKWYPTVNSLRESLEAEGWEVLEILPAPPLPLTDDSLGQRYGLSETDLSRIGNELPRDVSVPDDVMKKTHGRFCAFLHYWIYVCTVRD
jgi:hypothetical protein